MKQCQEGGSQQYRPTPRKKRDTKQLNCTPKATRGKKKKKKNRRIPELIEGKKS